MSKATAAASSEVEVFRKQARTVRDVVRMCVEGVSHEESLIQPQPGGNCMNWVVGHLLWAYQGCLPLLGQEPVMKEGVMDRYARRSPPLQDPAEAVEFRELMSGWDKAAERIEAGLAGLTPQFLDRPAPGSPSNDPNETVRSLLSTVFFHQAYHAGQTAILRRITGKEGAIR